MKNVIDLTKCVFDTDGVNPIITIDGDIYYVKDYNFVELVMCNFCKLIGIPCVDYQVAQKNNQLYLISKSFRKDDCNYIRGGIIIDRFLLRNSQELGVKDSKKHNLEIIWLALADRYRNNESKYNDIRSVIIELLKQYFLMILVQDADFHKNNWELEESSDHISLSPKFDNGSAFDWMEICGIPMGASIDDPFETSAQSLEYFLSITASIDNDLFIDLFEKATPEVLEKAILMVKEKYNLELPKVEARIISTYQEHRAELADVLKRRRLVR